LPPKNDRRRPLEVFGVAFYARHEAVRAMEGKKIIPHIISAIIGVVFGLSIVLMKHFFWLSFGLECILAMILFFVAGFILHVFIHEAGHLVAGKISGYGFVSIRFFNMMFINKDGKLTRKKYNVVGTLGQCLMSPPEPVNGKYPFVFYNLGGALMNFIFSVVFLAFYFIFPSMSALVSLLFVTLAFAGIFMGLFSIIPLNMGVPNDGHNALTLGKDDVTRHALWSILNVNALLTKGFRLRDIPAEQVYLSDYVNLTNAERYKNALVISTETNRFEWLIDRHDFEEAKALAERLLHTAEKMLDIQKNDICCELLFLELIGECRKEEIDRLYSAALKKYIKATSSYVSRQRLMYAFSKLFLNDDTEAKKALEKFNKVCLSYPYAGDISANREMIDMVDDLAEKRKK